MSDETTPTFVALDWPPWIRWGQRKGALIDNEALAAVYPDHRYYARVVENGDVVFRRVGTVPHCGWCGRACSGRRTSWCSDACSTRFYRVWSWGAVSAYVIARDGERCTRCGTADPGSPHGNRLTGFDVDHIVPVKDGGTDDPAKLRTLCQRCHVAVGYEQRRARKARTAPELALGDVA
jgi:5-methylcytosine-specific restriction endonuclease McrA